MSIATVGNTTAPAGGASAADAVPSASPRSATHQDPSAQVFVFAPQRADLMRATATASGRTRGDGAASGTNRPESSQADEDRRKLAAVSSASALTALAPLTIHTLNSRLLVGGGAAGPPRQQGEQSSKVGPRGAGPDAGRETSSRARAGFTSPQPPAEPSVEAGRSESAEASRHGEHKPETMPAKPTGRVTESRAEPSRTEQHANRSARDIIPGTVMTPRVAGPGPQTGDSGAAGARREGGSRIASVAGATGGTGTRGGEVKPGGAVAQPALRSARNAENAAAAQVTRGLFAAIRQGGGSLTMRLQPEHLGPIRIEMQVRESKIEAKITAETGQARELLSKSLETLRTSLEDRGLSVERLTIAAPPRAGDPSRPEPDREPGGGPNQEPTGAWDADSESRRESEAPGGGAAEVGDVPAAESAGVAEPSETEWVWPVGVADMAARWRFDSTKGPQRMVDAIA